MMEIQNNESRRLLDAEYGEEETGVRSEQDEYLDKVKNGKLYLATFAAVLGPLSFGFVLGYSSPAIPELSTITDQRLQLDKEEASWFGSIVTIGAAIGGLLGGWMVDRIGRKLSLMFCSIPYIFGFTIIIAAQNVWMLYLGRVLTGLASGVTSLVVPLYISEMAHERVRGAMGSCVQLMVVTGIMGVYIAVTRSSRFMLYNICRVGPYLTQEVAQVLVQALVISHLDYCNSLLAGCHQTPAIYPERCSLPGVQPSHVTPLLRMLHWLPVEAHIHYKTMVLDYGAARGTAPPYLQAILNPYTPTRALRFSTSGLMALPSLWEGSSHSAQSKVFSVLVPQCWNQLPPEARTAESLPKNI